MQQSGHIGKILVRPPPPGRRHGKGCLPKRSPPIPIARISLPEASEASGSQRRSGWSIAAPVAWRWSDGQARASEAAQEAVAALSRRGVDVRVAALDVSDRQPFERLMADLAATMPPLAGVMHAAMTLDDAVAANLDEARLLKV